jgi:hypothetical protein
LKSIDAPNINDTLHVTGPQAPLTSYQLFARHQTAQLFPSIPLSKITWEQQKHHSGIACSRTELSIMIETAWKGLINTQQNIYVDQERADKKRYEQQLEVSSRPSPMPPTHLFLSLYCGCHYHRNGQMVEI